MLFQAPGLMVAVGNAGVFASTLVGSVVAVAAMLVSAGWAVATREGIETTVGVAASLLEIPHPGAPQALRIVIKTNDKMVIFIFMDRSALAWIFALDLPGSFLRRVLNGWRC